MSYYSGLNIDSTQRLKYNVVSEINSTYVPLGIGGSWEGPYLDVSEFAEICVLVNTNVSGILIIYSSVDGVFEDSRRELPILTDPIVQPPYPADFQGISKTHVFKCNSKYMKVGYLNLTVAQDLFRLQTRLAKIGGEEVFAVGEAIDGITDAKVVKSVITGINKYDVYTNTGVNTRGDLYTDVRDSSMYDSMNVNNLDQVISGQFSYNYINTRLYNSSVLGSGSVIGFQTNARSSTGTTAGSFGTLASNKKISFRPGMGVVLNCNFSFTNINNTEVYAGIGNTSNGFFLGWRNLTPTILHRNNSTGLIFETWIDRSSWNGDQCLGENVLPLIDFTKLNNIQIVYTSVECVFYVQDPLTNQMVEIHRITGKNNLNYGLLGNTSLSFFSSAYNLAVASDAYVDVDSFGMFVQGVSKRNGLTNSTDFSKIGVSTTLTNILTIRNNITFNGIVNQQTVYPLTVNVASFGAAKPVLFKIIKNGVLGGVPLFNNIGANSIVAFDTDGTTITGGNVITSFYIGKEDSKLVDLSIIDPFLVPTDIFTIGCSATLGNADVNVSCTWREDI